ncbi:hypothetical protein A3Q56_05856 [Intoshia linei]|uniref:Uncharacterized protein n=1 Tax=Intoshia linei TaxID=1819745 RepID=A0A177AZ11_9BILA|nr:hypothetical protein A3Q56_05856 [Intoshia linei]
MIRDANANVKKFDIGDNRISIKKDYDTNVLTRKRPFDLPYSNKTYKIIPITTNAYAVQSELDNDIVTSYF